MCICFQDEHHTDCPAISIGTCRCQSLYRAKEGTIARRFREHYEGKSEAKNSKVLAGFVAYCKAHPEERFWQALRNWSGYVTIIAENPTGNTSELLDTYYWEGIHG